jgi:carbon-monoxide dehydrogenase medium subunit
MKPPAFTHHRCRTVDDAVGVLGSTEDARVLSGGQSLVPMMNLRQTSPAHLVDLNGIPGLDGIEAGEGTLSVGAVARQSKVQRSAAVRTATPLVGAALAHVGHPQTRNRGTVVGSVCHADPAGEMPAVFATLGGTVTAQGPDGTRTIAAEDFFSSAFSTSLGAREVATAVTFDVPATGTGWSFEEVTRRHGGYAIVGVVTLVTVTDGVVGEARITVLGGAAVPLRVTAAEQALVGVAVADVDPDLLARLADLTAGALNPVSDVQGSAAYRRHVAGVMVTRGIPTSLERATSAA